MEHTTNMITLRGALLALPAYSHTNHNKRCYRFTLEVPRLSGAVDLLPVVAEEKLIMDLDPTAGDMLTINGQVRSYNERNENGRHLLIFVFASAISVECGEPLNDV